MVQMNLRPVSNCTYKDNETLGTFREILMPIMSTYRTYLPCWDTLRIYDTRYV